jgi:phosphoenolpyruvate-protein phosphotransferase (PTS system enzyme I)
MSLAKGAVLSGLGVGLNSATGEVHIFKGNPSLPAFEKSNQSPELELEVLNRALKNVAGHLDELSQQASENSDSTSAEIFEVLKFLLNDEELFELAQKNIAEGWSAAASYGKAVDTFAELISGDDDLDQRVSDLQDMSKRVQADIAGVEINFELPKIGRVVLVADDFSPIETAKFTDVVVGVITLKGGPTSHTAIICRSRGIPAVVSCGTASLLANGDTVLVDPVGDRVLFGGDQSLATKSIEFIVINEQPLIPVRANIGTLADAQSAASKTKADGVGLFRTELLYLNSRIVPTVKEQAAKYEAILSAAPEGPIVVRTIDAGSDKPVPFLLMPHENNPALGVRGYRMIQDHRNFIKDQLKSLEMARVKTGREVWVMAPMIATVQEAQEFTELARSIGKYQVGIMVETPSIAAMVDHLTGIVDFISIGTNDLSQYLFAADRMNSNLGALSNHWQPALIRTIARIASGAVRGGFSVGVCGESASDPAFAVVLAGLGVDSVSVSVSQVGAVLESLSAMDLAKAKEVANRVLMATSPEEAKTTALAALAEL